MIRYKISGMSCAACSARVEQAVSTVEGVSDCTVNLLTNSMEVEGTATPDAVISAVSKAGYGASIMNDDYDVASQLDDTETAPMVRRLIVSLVFLIPLMYISMGHSMWGWPLPDFFEKSLTGGITQGLLALVIMIINSYFFISGFKGLVHRSPNMDTLVAIGSGASFGYSVYSLAMHSGHHLYFESAAMILVLITVGKILESYSKGKTTNA
ncbi:MAG: cation transporter, partial [Eubacterium sp.]